MPFPKGTRAAIAQPDGSRRAGVVTFDSHPTMRKLTFDDDGSMSGLVPHGKLLAA